MPLSSKPRFEALHSMLVRNEDAIKRTLGQLERLRGELDAGIAAAEKSAIDAGAAVLGTDLRDQYTRYWRAKAEEVRQLRDRLGVVDRDIDSTRTALTEAHRQTLAIKELRNRDQELTTRREQRMDARIMDEFGLRQNASLASA